MRRGARTINRSIRRMWENSWRFWAAVILILGAIYELVSREGREKLLMSCFLCGKWCTTTSVISIVPSSLSVLELLSLYSSVVPSDVTILPFYLLMCLVGHIAYIFLFPLWLSPMFFHAHSETDDDPVWHCRSQWWVVAVTIWRTEEGDQRGVNGSQSRFLDGTRHISQN
jgi:hypothetical protein